MSIHALYYHSDKTAAREGEESMETKQRRRVSLELFSVFFKIGAFTFGGGYAMIPLIQREVVEKKKWITDEDILEIIAIAESTPGPIAINSATFVGQKLCGFWGAFLASLGVVLPSFLIIFAISSVLRQFEDVKAVQYAFVGIRAGVLALICKSLYSMYRQCPKDAVSLTIAGLAFVAVAIFDISVLLVLVACAATGLCTSLIAARKEERR